MPKTKVVEEQQALLTQKRRENELLAAEIARQKAELEETQKTFSTNLLNTSAPIPGFKSTQGKWHRFDLYSLNIVFIMYCY